MATRCCRNWWRCWPSAATARKRSGPLRAFGPFDQAAHARTRRTIRHVLAPFDRPVSYEAEDRSDESQEQAGQPHIAASPESHHRSRLDLPARIEAQALDASEVVCEHECRQGETHAQRGGFFIRIKKKMANGLAIQAKPCASGISAHPTSSTRIPRISMTGSFA